MDSLASGVSWWNLNVPFFAIDWLSTYVTTLVSCAFFQDPGTRLAVLRLFCVLTVLSLRFVFELLLWMDQTTDQLSDLLSPVAAHDPTRACDHVASLRGGMRERCTAGALDSIPGPPPHRRTGLLLKVVSTCAKLRARCFLCQLYLRLFPQQGLKEQP